MTDPMRIGGASHPIADRFIARLATMPAPRVLELGTLRADPNVPTHHREWAPSDADYEMGDIQHGPDVTIKLDAHALTKEFYNNLDAIIAIAVWEHLREPWQAALEALCALRHGGLIYVQTHMAFPRHGYPSDYTRWTVDGLEALFEWAGFEVLEASHTYPCDIVPRGVLTRWNAAAPAWLNVDLFAVKP